MNLAVSIIIINYNTFGMTSECVQSVIDHTKQISYEVVLVDNGSKECDPKLFSEKFPQIKIVKSPINLGFAKGNNLGIQHAEGDVILLLNSDVLLVEDSISLCYNRFIDDNEIGVITCKLVYPDFTIQKQCHRLPSIKLSLIELLRIHKFWNKEKRSRVLLNGYLNHESEIFSERIWGTYFMIKKELLFHFPQKQLSETFFMYGEDTEWCFIITKIIKKKILYFSSTKVIHRVGGSNFKERNRIIKNNRHKFLSLYYGKFKTIAFQILDFFN